MYTIDPSGSTSFEAVGFAVEGITAWRQWGRVSLLVDGDWRVGWSDDLQLRRVDPPANVRQQGFVGEGEAREAQVIDYSVRDNVAERLVKRFGASIGESAIRALRHMEPLR